MPTDYIKKLKHKINGTKNKEEPVLSTKDILKTFQQKRNKLIKYFDHFITTALIDDEIINDEGASFTEIKRTGDRITKKALPQGNKKLIDEINWYLYFKGRITISNSYLPKILDYDLDKENPSYTMKHYSCPSFRTLIFDHKISNKEIIDRFTHINKFLIKNIYSHESIETPINYVQKAHFEKLKKRISISAKKAPRLIDIFKTKVLTINEEKYINLSALIPEIIKDDEITDKLKPPRLHMVHGDLHYNNILCGVRKNVNILLDCRGRSPYGTIQCDVAYDIAKWIHEFKGKYSLIERNEYCIFLHEKRGEIEINYEFTNEEILNKYDELINPLNDILDKQFKNKDFGNWRYRAEFIESMLYLTMIPFHLNSLHEGLMCYVRGIISLNEWMKKYHPEKYSKLSRRFLK